MNQKIKLYRLHTLVDITNTGVTSGGGMARNQQRNWETILQVLGLRTQLHHIYGPELLPEAHPTKYGLGWSHRGPHNIWTMDFVLEFDNVFGSGDDPFHILTSDFENVPVITGLTETVVLDPPIFMMGPWDRNVVFIRV